MWVRWGQTERWNRKVLVALTGALLLTLLTTARAKPTITFQLSQLHSKLPDIRQIVEKRLVRPMKNYSERRLDAGSLRMIYFHDQTVAIVELGHQKRLIGCELIEINTDAEGEELLRDLAAINRPLEIAFRDMVQLMEQCEQVDRQNERSRFPDHGDEDEDATGGTTPRPPLVWAPPNGSDADGAVGYRIAGDPDVTSPGPGPSMDPPDGDGFFAMILRSIASKRSPGYFVNPLSLLRGIIPGTKWCGTGDIADSYHDLGQDAPMDRCCRTHDLCPLKVRALQERYNLTNGNIYTTSHCTCDDMLFDCLKQTNTTAAQWMGSIYFNIVQVPCLEEGPGGLRFRAALKGF